MVHADQKIPAVLRLLEVEEFDALIAFVRTKQATLDLAAAGSQRLQSRCAER
jgi:ATP-dependent RNA helicase DeaD